MFRLATVFLGLLALVSAWLALNQRAHAHELEAELAAAKARACPPSAPSSNLTNLLSLAASARKNPPPAAKPAPTVHAADDGEHEPERDFDSMSGDEQRSLFDTIDKLKSGGAKHLDDVVRELHLDGAKERELHERIERMNQQVLAAADRLVTSASQKEPSAMALIEPLADGFDAIARADREFRNSLDDDQRAVLKKDDCDLTSQLDAAGLFTRMLAFTAATK
jgi:hypothetical protein